jgi:hypothetical protein
LVRAFRAGHLSLISLSSEPQLSAPSPTSSRPSSPALPPLTSHQAPPNSTPLVPPSRYHIPFIFPPLIPLLNPLPSSMALKPLTPVLIPPATPPQRSPDPYKRRGPPLEFTAPLPASFRFTPRSSLPLTERRRLCFCTIVARPPRRRPSSGDALAKLPVLSSLFCAPAGELWCTRKAGGRPPVTALPRSGTLCPRRCWSMVDRARPAGPRTRGSGPRPLPLENNSLINISENFTKKPLCFFEINPRSSFCSFCT